MTTFQVRTSGFVRGSSTLRVKCTCATHALARAGPFVHDAAGIGARRNRRASPVSTGGPDYLRSAPGDQPMKFDDVVERVAGIPYTSPQKGKIFYDFVMDTKPAQCLELGFAHGTSSCYIAAALHELGRGHLTSVDLDTSVERDPSIEVLLKKTGLEPYVTVVREKTGYNWFLKKKIEEQTKEGACQPLYDFCFIDGAKNWTIDGFAFFLVDKLLNEGAWLQFDDYSWTYAHQQERTGKNVSDGIEHAGLSSGEFQEPHIKAIFHDLVMQHPDYANFRVVDNSLAYAQKTKTGPRRLRIDTEVSFKYKVVTALRKLLR
jgi:predicted O-methyltransferase YrrM